MGWTGAFGDLGTLIPFIVAYIAAVKMDPLGILFSFDIALVVSGIRYRNSLAEGWFARPHWRAAAPVLQRGRALPNARLNHRLTLNLSARGQLESRPRFSNLEGWRRQELRLENSTQPYDIGLRLFLEVPGEHAT